MQLNHFQLNRKKKISLLLNDLKFFIKNFVQDNSTKNLIKYIAKNLEVPEDILQKELKIILFKNFENLHGKFNKKFKFKNIFFFSINFFLFIAYIFFFSKKNESNSKYYDIIIDDIDTDNSPKRFFLLKRLFKVCFICNDKKYKGNTFFLFDNWKSCSKNIPFIEHPKKIFNIFFITLYYSLKTSNNLFPIVLDFVKTILKYETIFGKITSTFLIQERHYNTSELKNYIFKKFKGKYSCVTQKNILQMNGPGMYVHADILFALGTKTADYLKNFGGEVKKIIPVGSLAMEYNYYKRKDVNKTTTFDLLVFASDHNKIFHSGYDAYYKEYIRHFDWVKKFSSNYSYYKIGIKLKSVITDENVIKKFEGTKNVKFLFDKTEMSDSYYFANNAKAICTWSSTLAFEFLGAGRVVYFIDPGSRNISFLPNDNYIKKFKINNYQEFNNKILLQIKRRNLRFYKNKILQESFCLNSSNVTKNLFQALKNLN
jgi:hypothetical protein